MKYAILNYGDESQLAQADAEHRGAISQDYAVYARALVDAGVMKMGEALQSTATATSVRVKGSQKTLIHGPFAETKEQLLGFYILECSHLDDAVEWAAQCPGAKTGTMEVRPIWDLGNS